MPQHFLLSPSARSLSLSEIMRMTDDEARDTFKRIRWSENNAEPFCPHCGCLIVYTLAETPPRWKCSACRRKFSLTSGTLFHSRKLAVRDYLAVIALFVNGVKGTSALQISRDLNINPKSSFVLLHKLREAMGSQVHNPDQPELTNIDIGLQFKLRCRPESDESHKNVSYEMIVAQPLSLEKFVPLLTDQYRGARDCFERYLDLVREQHALWPKSVPG